MDLYAKLTGLVPRYRAQRVTADVNGIATVDPTAEVMEMVKCECCGRHFATASTAFVVFYGNVNIGLEGGVLGNNFHCDDRDEAVLARGTVLCRGATCLSKYLIAKLVHVREGVGKQLIMDTQGGVMSGPELDGIEPVMPGSDRHSFT